MAETRVVGVDFSGAGEDSDVGKTWVTKGRFDGKTLSIDEGCPHPTSRTNLEALLKEMAREKGAVAAMDFPFAVPIEFAKWWVPSAVEMPSLWKAAACTDFQSFKQKVSEFPGGQASQLLRVGDLNYSNAQPCLKDLGRPTMINMTFRGMQMLHRLWESGHFKVPPMAHKELPQQSMEILEVMPGAALDVFGLRSTRYKDGDKEDRQERRKMRCQLLKCLECASGVQIDRLDLIWNKYVDDQGGDALDSLVAAIVAARWTRCKDDFLIPMGNVIETLKRNTRNKRQASNKAKGTLEIDTARLEGWIYAPKK